MVNKGPLFLSSCWTRTVLSPADWWMEAAFPIWLRLLYFQSLTFSFLKFADLLSGAEVFISVGMFDGGRRAGGGGGGER